MNVASCAETKEKVALLSCAGPFPALLARAAARQGVEILALGWEGKVDEDLASAAARMRLYPFGLIEGMLEVLEDENINKAMLAGKFDKNWIYQGKLEIDETGRAFLEKLKDHRDDTMLGLVEKVLRERGIEVVDNTRYIKHWLAPAGVLTERRPTDAEKEDIEFGIRMIREIGRLGIGQSVVVKRGNVVAVEAMEHTDETIQRAGRLAGEGSVVVKAARPGQDMRYDVPVVGIETLQSMDKAKASTIAVEAKNTILIEKEKLIAQADRSGICIVGVETE